MQFALRTGKWALDGTANRVAISTGKPLCWSLGLRGSDIILSKARDYEVRREIEATLDDTTLPRHLQVSWIIDLFDPHGDVDIIDFWPDDLPTARPKKATETNDSSPLKRPARKKRAKATKRAI